MEFLFQRGELVVVDDSASVSEFLGLVDEFFENLWMAVSVVAGSDSSNEIEVLVT